MKVIYLVLSMFVADQPELSTLTIECRSVECVRSVIARSQSSDVYHIRVLDAEPHYWGMNIVDQLIAEFTKS